MANHTNLSSLFTAIADAIRTKTGKTGKIVADNFPSEIGNIVTNPTLQSKTVTSSTSNQTVKPDSGYYGLSQVTVNAISTATQATPSITVGTDGLITASATQTAGYVAAGTKSATKQLTTQAAKTVTPTTSEQTAVASGRYTTGAVKVAAMPTATQATPSITVGTDGLITASATQTAGYVSAGTKSATKQLTVQAAKTITPSTSGQTAVAKGRYTTGAVKVAAIPSDYVKPTATKAATTYTPKTTNQTIAAGTYCSGAQTIKGDSNLTASNIASGVSIFGVTGTFAAAPVLLWTNASPTSDFAAQTVTLSASAYSAYILEIKNFSNGNVYDKVYLPFGFTGYIYSTESASSNARYRKVTEVSNTKITFDTGRWQSTGAVDMNNYAVPTRIWGVKFTL